MFQVGSGLLGRIALAGSCRLRRVVGSVRGVVAGLLIGRRQSIATLLFDLLVAIGFRNIDVVGGIGILLDGIALGVGLLIRALGRRICNFLLVLGCGLRGVVGGFLHLGSSVGLRFGDILLGLLRCFLFVARCQR